MTADHTASLREIADLQEFYMGAAANAHALRTDSAYRETLAEEFNFLTAENELKFGNLCPEPKVYNFGPADELVFFAKANFMHIRGHTLVWHHQNPPWLIEGDFNRNQALELLHEHIFTTMGHFHEEIEVWDVVNEPIEADGSLRDSFWMHTIGPDYIEYAFRWAHEADPSARLFLNDYSAEGINSKSNAIYNTAKELLALNVPIHGVGMQMHIAINGTEKLAKPPDTNEMYENMKRLGDLGLEIHITEMDVAIQNATGSLEDRLRQQADVYERILGTALRVPQFKACILWGVADRYSWIPGFTGHPDEPLIFDQYYQPKPAYESIHRTLEAMLKTSSVS